MKKKPRGEPAKHEAFPELAAAIGVYLEAVGWRALVVGNPRIEQPIGAAKHNFEFVVKFTGGKKA